MMLDRAGPLDLGGEPKIRAGVVEHQLAGAGAELDGGGVDHAGCRSCAARGCADVQRAPATGSKRDVDRAS